MGASTMPNRSTRGSADGRRRFAERLPSIARDDLADLGVLRTVAGQQVVFLQGEAHGRVAIVERGLFKVTAATEDGRCAFLGIRGPGDAIGLTDVLSRRSRMSTVTSIGSARLRMLTADEFEAFLDRHPEAREEMVGLLVERLRDDVAWRLRAGAPVPARLAAALVDLAAAHGHGQVDGSTVIDLALTQDDLATLVATSRDSVAKTLMSWRRQGLVETRRRSIVVLDIDFLRGVR